MSFSDLQMGSSHRPCPANSSSATLPKHHNSEPSSPDAVESPAPGLTASTLDRTSTVPSPFAFSNDDLFRLNTTDNNITHAAFEECFGGLRGLEYGLRTDLRAGLGVDEDHLDGTVTLESALNAARSLPTSSPQLCRLDAVTTVHPDRRASAVSTVASAMASFPRATPRVLPWTGEDDSVNRGHTTRRKTFGENELPPPKQIALLTLIWYNFTQKFVLLLAFMAVLFTVIAVFEAGITKSSFAAAEPAIPAALVLFFSVGPAFSDWIRRRKHPKAHTIESDVTVIRSGRAWVIPASCLVVGDVVQIKQGDVSQADGLLIAGCEVRVDESTITGESKALRKVGAAKPAPKRDQQHGSSKSNDEPADTHHKMRHLKHSIILGGSRIFKGTGRYLITAVGPNTVNGGKYMAEPTPPAKTPLQEKLDRLAVYIVVAGSVIATVFLVSQSIIWAASNPGSEYVGKELALHWFKILMISLALLVVLVPEGLPLANHFALEFACRRMLEESIWVRCLASCETAGNATTVLCDKTGTLTENEMTVVEGMVGKSFHLRGSSLPKTFLALHKPSLFPQFDSQDTSAEKRPQVGGSGLCSGLCAEVTECLRESIARNTTAHQEDGKFEGSATETSLLRFAKIHLGMDRLEVEEARSERVKMYPFSPEQKWMAVVVEKPRREGCRILVKGAPEAVLPHCRKIFSHPSQGDFTKDISDAEMEVLMAMVRFYANHSLRVIVLAHADLEEWPPASSSEENSLRVVEDSDDTDADEPPDLGRVTAGNLTLTAMLGIHDPIRPGVNDSVRSAQDAGVTISMVTGDSMLTAKSIAGTCNIYRRGGVIMEAGLYQQLSDGQIKAIAPRLHVLSRSMPEDKARLVRCHQELGETVIVTGDGTNDAAALRAADVGFSMGRCGTEVAKEASDIILQDDNFHGIVRAVAWGRQVNDVVKRFLQFQATPILACAILTIVSAFKDGYDSSIFSAVQMLWINASTDIIAGATLTRDFPQDVQMHRRPEPRNTTITTVAIRKMIICQLLYQVGVTLILYYACGQALTAAPIGGDGDEASQNLQLHTLVFNTFMFMQLFLLLNSRSCDNDKNIFTGLFRKSWNFIRAKWFVALVLIITGAQIVIVETGRPWLPFGTVPLTSRQWALSIGLGLFTLPLGFASRCIPDAYHAAVENFLLKLLMPVWNVFLVCWRRFSAPFRPPGRWVRRKVTAFAKFTALPLNALGRVMKQHIRHAWQFVRGRRGNSRTVLPATNQRDSRCADSRTWKQRTFSLFQSRHQQTNDTTFSKANTVVNTPRPGSNHSKPGQVWGTHAGSCLNASSQLANRQQGPGADKVELLELIQAARKGPVEGFEIHPDTDPDDPILWQGPAGKGMMPPSQREEVRRWFGPKAVE